MISDNQIDYDRWRKQVSEHLRNMSEWDSADRFKVANRWDKCHKVGIKYQCLNGDYEVVLPYRCELRICPKCAKRHKELLYMEYRDLPRRVVKRKNMRFWFICLTVRYDKNHAIETLEKRIDLLLDKSREFVKHFWGKEKGFGFMGIIEIVNSGYVHLHGILYAQNCPKQEERNEYWKRLTGEAYPEFESYRTQQKRLNCFRDGLLDMLKYITKTQNYSPEMAAYVLKALHKRRRIYTMGAFYNNGEIDLENFVLCCPICGQPLVADYRNEIANFEYCSYYEHSPPGGMPILKKREMLPADCIVSLERYRDWQYNLVKPCSEKSVERELRKYREWQFEQIFKEVLLDNIKV